MVFGFARFLEGEAIIVAINFAHNDADFYVDCSPLTKIFNDDNLVCAVFYFIFFDFTYICRRFTVCRIWLIPVILLSIWLEKNLCMRNTLYLYVFNQCTIEQVLMVKIGKTI